MASNFHLRNKAKVIQINETTQNFEYFNLKIKSEALSAIINVGAFKFPLVISGMTEASTTLKFSIP